MQRKSFRNKTIERTGPASIRDLWIVCKEPLHSVSTTGRDVFNSRPKIVYNFGLPEYNRAKVYTNII